MARITVEDCLQNIDNIFEMVLENDKPTVIALREIAEGHITPAILEEIEQPVPEEFLQPEPPEDILPMRGISIGD